MISCHNISQIRRLLNFSRTIESDVIPLDNLQWFTDFLLVFFFSDIDECSSPDSNNCHKERGQCTNTIGSFKCRCVGGFLGDGVNCNGKFYNESIEGKSRKFREEFKIINIYDWYSPPWWCKLIFENAW